MIEQQIMNQIKKALEEVHFGLSPDSDIYVNKIYIYRRNNDEILTFKNSADLIKSIIENKISTEEVDLDSMSVLFSDLLFKEINQEYQKYAMNQ